jgi:hypothetical protein
MTKALIFDLDNCLAPANAVGEELFEPAFDAIRTAGAAIGVGRRGSNPEVIRLHWARRAVYRNCLMRL